MKNLYKFSLLLIFSITYYSSAQNSKLLSGTYQFGSDIEKESIGQIQLVHDTGNIYFIRLEVSKAAPSYSTSQLFTKLTINKNYAEYLSKTNEGCKLQFTFSNNQIIIKDESTLQWGSAWVSRTYQKTSNIEPEFFYLGNGDKIAFSEDSNHFSENYFNKTNQYIWGEAICDYTGFYYAKDFNDVQMQRAYEIADIYNTDRQNIFSSWYNSKNEADIDAKIAFFNTRYTTIKNKIKALNHIPSHNQKLWDNYITNNLQTIDELLSLHKLLLKSFYNTDLLKSSEYYLLVKKAVSILNSDDNTITVYYNKLVENDAERVSTIDQMKKHIYAQKIHNPLISTVQSRYQLFSNLFISIEENCSDGPY
ncbi:MAG: hypothetical protein ACPGU9_06425 [Flavobacteriaceae bacterium]